MEKTKKICYNLGQQTNRSLVCARLKGLNMEYTPIEKNVLSMMQRRDMVTIGTHGGEHEEKILHRIVGLAGSVCCFIMFAALGRVCICKK